MVRDPHLDRALDRRQRGKAIVIGAALAAMCMVVLVVLHKLAGKQLKGLIPLGVLSLYALLFHKLVPDFAEGHMVRDPLAAVVVLLHKLACLIPLCAIPFVWVPSDSPRCAERPTGSTPHLSR